MKTAVLELVTIIVFMVVVAIAMVAVGDHEYRPATATAVGAEDGR